MAKFSEILTIVNGKNQGRVENPNGRYPIYGSGGVMGYADDYLCGAETVVIGRKGSINKPIYVEEPFWNVDTAFGLVANRDMLLPKYLFYFCVYFDFEQLNTTVTIPSLTKANLLNIEMNLPSLTAQQEIVERLSKVDELITLRKEQLAKLDQLVKSRFIELFGNRGENPYNFPTTTMGNIYKFQYGKGNNIPEDKGEYPCYGSNGVVGHHTEYNSEDSPIIGHIGAYAGIVNWGKGKHYVTYNGVICKLMNDQVNPVYGYYLLQLQDYNTVAKSGAAQPFVSYKDLDAPVVNVPPMDLQKHFAAFVEQTDKSKLAIQASLDKLELLKKSLMQEYFG